MSDQTNSKASGEPERVEFDSDQLVFRLDVNVSASKSSVSPVVERIMTFARTMGCAAGKENAIELAIQEAIANAVVHGCREDPGKSVKVTVACEEEHGMLIVVRDPGVGFDPTSVPSPLVGENIYASHGRGIYLINQLMDEVRYERGGTEIWMRKH